MDDILNITADDIFATPADEREALYDALRDAMRDEYQRVCPRKARKIRNRIARRRQAAQDTAQRAGRFTRPNPRHQRHADRLEADQNRREDRYYGGGEREHSLQALKHALAILCGRYDDRMPTVYGDRADSLKARAARTRLTELGRPVVEHEIVLTSDGAETRPM